MIRASKNWLPLDRNKGNPNNVHDTLWYAERNAIRKALDYAQFYSRSHHTVIRVYDEAGNVIETHEHKGDFKEW
jgi:hypothetical protein